MFIEIETKFNFYGCYIFMTITYICIPTYYTNSVHVHIYISKYSANDYQLYTFERFVKSDVNIFKIKCVLSLFCEFYLYLNIHIVKKSLGKTEVLYFIENRGHLPKIKIFTSFM